MNEIAIKLIQESELTQERKDKITKMILETEKDRKDYRNKKVRDEAEQTLNIVKSLVVINESNFIEKDEIIMHRNLIRALINKAIKKLEELE